MGMMEFERPSAARRSWRGILIVAIWGALHGLGWAGADPAATSPWPQSTLHADRWWLVNLPGGGRVDASGLLQFPDGAMWLVNDQNASVYRLQFRDATNAVDLERIPGLLTREQVDKVTGGRPPRLDTEGLGRDGQGRVYISDESRRLILRWDPATRAMETLTIDWSPVRSFFNPGDPNASFEGVAVGGDRLYVANERQRGRIIVVDLATLKVVDHFAVSPFQGMQNDPHYTDLCWAENALWVLMREERKVLKVDPAAKRVLEEYDYAELEKAPATSYGLIYSPGFMEGLAVDARFIWLLVDNNGIRRTAAAGDTRPTLFRCPRPGTNGDSREGGSTK